MKSQIPSNYLSVRQGKMADLTDFLNQKIINNPAV